MERAVVSHIEPGASMQRPPIVLTTRDFNRLSALLNNVSENDSSAAHFLREELDRADIVHREVGTTSLVTMGSEVSFIDQGSVSVQQVRLAYPNEIKDSCSISVLTSTGSALLGLGPGQSISWSEKGKERRLTVLTIR
jgi:regulator of nucleoside diphosphate kinase